MFSILIWGWELALVIVAPVFGSVTKGDPEPGPPPRGARLQPGLSPDGLSALKRRPAEWW